MQPASYAQYTSESERLLSSPTHSAPAGGSQNLNTDIFILYLASFLLPWWLRYFHGETKGQNIPIKKLVSYNHIRMIQMKKTDPLK